MKVAAATSCSSEGRYLLEWVAHHTILGFDRFYIFTHNNEEDEDFLEAKRLLEATGIVTFHESIRTGENRCFQMENFCRARDFSKDEHIDWLWCADLDEYLVLSNHPTVKHLLRDVPKNAAQVSFCWLIYGSNGEQSRDPDRLHFERFPRHAKVDYFDNQFVKSFVRPQMAGTMHLHLHEVRGHRLNSSLRSLRINGRCSARIDFGNGFLAHFCLRSREEFEFKQRRGYASDVHLTKIDEEYWDNRDQNDLAGPPLTTHILHLKERLKSWKAGSLQTYAIENHNLHENQIQGYPHQRCRMRPVY